MHKKTNTIQLQNLRHRKELGRKEGRWKEIRALTRHSFRRSSAIAREWSVAKASVPDRISACEGGEAGGKSRELGMVGRAE